MYLKDNKSPFKRIVMSAPLIGVKLDAPEMLVHTAVKAVLAIGFTANYALGYEDQIPSLVKVENSNLSHSNIRLTRRREVFIEKPDILGGGPSYGWVDASLRGTRQIRASHISNLPKTLLLLSGQDAFVKTEDSLRFCAAHDQCISHIYQDSNHSILYEKDDIRDDAIGKILSFFAEH
jgi:lysophospholipase